MIDPSDNLGFMTLSGNVGWDYIKSQGEWGNLIHFSDSNLLTSKLAENMDIPQVILYRKSEQKFSAILLSGTIFDIKLEIGRMPIQS